MIWQAGRSDDIKEEPGFLFKSWRGLLYVLAAEKAAAEGRKECEMVYEQFFKIASVRSAQI